MPKYDFSCERGHRFEATVERDVRSARCVVCRAPAERLLSVPYTIVGDRPLTPKSQRAVHIGEYVEASQQLDYEFNRYRDATQQEALKEPPLWSQAKQAANAVLAGKRKPPKGWTPVSFT